MELTNCPDCDELLDGGKLTTSMGTFMVVYPYYRCSHCLWDEHRESAEAPINPDSYGMRQIIVNPNDPIVEQLQKQRDEAWRRLNDAGGRGIELADAVDRLDFALDALRGELFCRHCEARLTSGLPQAPAPAPDPLPDTVEITSPEASPELVLDCWAEGVMYKGRSVFDTLYVSGDIFSATTGKVPANSQECYLGYIPSRDRFIVGFDAWWDEDEEEHGNTVFIFELSQEHAKSRILKLEPVEGMDNPMFYDGNHDELKRRYPDLLDVRLD